MTEFIFIRHGEPNYEEVKKYIGEGYNFGKLSDTGILQAKRRAEDLTLKNADIIISSPYTRALQTAAIISKKTQIELLVEHDLHEWLPDVTLTFKKDLQIQFEKYLSQRGIPQKNDIFESYENLKIRVDKVLAKYKNFKKVIVVCHGIVITTQTHFDDILEHCGLRKVYK